MSDGNNIYDGPGLGDESEADSWGDILSEEPQSDSVPTPEQIESLASRQLMERTV